MVRKLVARILGGGRDAEPAEPARPSSAMLPRNPASEFAAVSITPGSPCCSAVAQLRGQRMLQASAPRLPLAGCSRPQDCKCRFQKHADRRGEDDDRRIAGLLQMSSWYAGSERRNKRGRRSGDA